VCSLIAGSILHAAWRRALVKDTSDEAIAYLVAERERYKSRCEKLSEEIYLMRKQIRERE
jgi:prefoldin subunit 5